jgi:hypothetical protein
LIVEELRELSLDLQKHLVGQAGTYLQDDRIVVQPTVIDLRVPALPSLLVESKHLPLDQQQTAEFCRHHHIRKLALFGSVLREDFGPQSDKAP